jgi:alpha-L-fucosidase
MVHQLAQGQGQPGLAAPPGTYGARFAYNNFIPFFNRDVKRWNPDAMAAFFEEVGAKYVVLTTKHHEGFTLWPSGVANKNFEGWPKVGRDIVGELNAAVRARAMKMGLYFSGGIDWSYVEEPFHKDNMERLENDPYNMQWVKDTDAQLRELIDKYSPSLVWNDIGYPPKSKMLEIVAEYYNAVPDGLVNDRWAPLTIMPGGIRELTKIGIMAWLKSLLGSKPAPFTGDFRTKEYEPRYELMQEKWEACRGVGYSFGYNQMETEVHYASAGQLIYELVDIVSKNGNFLLNVGPMADGTIPEAQMVRLRAIGQWLSVNGEAIYATRPWTRAEGTTDAGVEVRFTQKGDALYAVLLGRPGQRTVTIADCEIPSGARITLLPQAAEVPWSQQGRALAVTMPEILPDTPPYTFRIAPAR